MQFLSVIVPAYCDSEALANCLASLRRSTFQDFELLVADDGSPDPEGLKGIADHSQARFIRLHENQGPAAARNAAAFAATGDVLAFLDSDVTVHPDTLARIAAAFRSDPSLDALMGSYDCQPHVTGLTALFRNLLHTHVHQRSSRKATTFWTGCGAVRRSVFLQMGGFDQSFRRPSIEDVEFGMRLHKAGGKIALDPEVQVKHHKQWDLLAMVRTDVVDRAMPWTQLMLRYGLPRDLNFRWRDRWSAGFAALAIVFAVAAALHSAWWLGLAAVSAAIALGLEWELFLFLRREGGLPFALACAPLYLVHLWSGAAGFAAGLVRTWVTAPRADRRPAVLPVPDPETPVAESQTSVKSASTL